MKERPILFIGDMVRALLDGRKTQTRRLIKPQPILPIEDCDGIAGIKFYSKWHDCPYGKPGDRLWVKETWRPVGPWECRDDRAAIQCKADGAYLPNRPPKIPLYLKRNDRKDVWRPSIFMPRWASRITLEISEVRVQRVQDISDEDAKEEGADRGIYGKDEEGVFLRSADDDREDKIASHRQGYRFIWDTINAQRGYPWASNPWVWVIKFKKV